MKEKELNELKRELAATMVKYGINLKKEDEVCVYGSIDSPEFIEMLVEESYKAGAKRVIVNWLSSNINRLNYLYGKKETMSHFPNFEIERMEYEKKHKCPIIIAPTTHFGEYKNINLKKLNSIRESLIQEQNEHSARLENFSPWCCFFTPSKDWSKKLFPNLDEDKAVNKAWELFLKVSRVEKGKTESNWKKHLNDLEDKKAWLDSLNLVSLHYTSSNGTNLTIGLIPNNKWCGGFLMDKQKRLYCPNFPTEEVFTTPHKNKANGVVYSSKPLSYEGKVIEGIKLTLKDGKIIHYTAKKNKKLLKSIIKTDEGSYHLGEVALVPFDSLINQVNFPFYSTIYDENACCHLAIGFGFSFTVKNFAALDKKDLNEIGINNSNVHIDFMIGTSDLNIEGTSKDGKKIWIFKNGTWAK